VPREEQRAEEESPPSGEGWELPADLIEKLRPWIDVRTFGPVGFHQWLRTILPLLPPASPSPPHAVDLEGRIAEIAHSLVESAGDEAQAHFQASEYFRENMLLARRIEALEAMLRTARIPAPKGTPEIETAVERYLPQEHSK
jgi:hypothetical protein